MLIEQKDTKKPRLNILAEVATVFISPKYAHVSLGESIKTQHMR
jgi:hypothetical protein